MRIFVALISLLLPCVVFADQIPGSVFSSGNWHGAAYTDETGGFSHCVISAEYKSGDILFLSVTRGISVVVGVGGPNLRLTPGETIPVNLVIDNRGSFQGNAVARSETLAMLEIFDFQNAMRALQKGYLLRIQAPGRYGEYSLLGTFRALEAAKACARTYYNFQAPTGKRASGTSAVDPALTFQLATNMITGLGVTDARYLSADELKRIELDGAVYWMSESTGLSGGVMFFDRPDDFTLRMADTTSTQYLSRMCSGEIATTIRNVDGEFPSRQIRLICAESDGGGYETFLTNTLVGTRQLVTILSFDNDAEATTEASRPQISENLALRNASFVVEAER